MFSLSVARFRRHFEGPGFRFQESRLPKLSRSPGQAGEGFPMVAALKARRALEFECSQFPKARSKDKSDK